MAIEMKHKVFPREATIEAALATAQREYSGNGKFIASMPVLLKGFPHGEEYTANSEDISGIDKNGKYASKNEPVVITIHGGIEGCGMLTPEVIKRAKKEELTKVYSADFDKVFKDKDVITELLNDGVLPNNEKIPVIPYEQYAEDGMPEEYIRHAVVRPLSLARKMTSDYYPINDLSDNSQVIVYSGGRKNAKELLDNMKNKGYSKLGVWHPFNDSDFDANKSQGHVLFVGCADGVIFGSSSLNYYNERYVGVQLLEAQPK